MSGSTRKLGRQKGGGGARRGDINSPLSRGEARIFLVQECCCVLLLIVCEIIGYLWYGLSLVGFGLLISSLCSTQQQAFIGVFVFMMPAILLSGYVSPVENMPVWLQNLTWINPIRHFTDITKQIYLKDASLDIVWNSLWPLLVITATTGSAAYAMFRRKVM